MSSTVLLVVTAVAFAVAMEDRFEILGPGFKMTEYQHSLTVKSLSACGSECTRPQSPECIGFNFNNESHQCELIATKLSSDSQSLMQTSSSWRLFDRGPCSLGERDGLHCHYFVAIGSAVTWNGSRSTCLDMGVGMAIVSNISEMGALNNELSTAFPSGGAVWLGAFSQDGVVMKWVDGSTLIFNYFSQSPAVLSMEAACLLARHQGTNVWRWEYFDCATALIFVCERRSV